MLDAAFRRLAQTWELYAMWTLVTLFFAGYFAGRGAAGPRAEELAGVVGFSVIAVGGVASVLAGVWADRLGRERVAMWAMAVSGACALGIGWLGAAPPWLVVGVGLVWGFTVVADSAQFSALVTEVAPPHAVGTALTLQTSLGFLLTTGSISLATEVAERVGWGPAFSLLAVGPALGIAAMLRLKASRTPPA